MRIGTKKLVMFFEDESGYKFAVDAEEISPSKGWCGSVTLHTSGMNSAEAVLAPILISARQLVRMLEKEVPEKDR